MNSEYKLCPNCFTNNVKYAEFCKNCGFNFEQHDADEFDINLFYNVDDLIDDAVLVYKGEDFDTSLELIDLYIDINSENPYAWAFKAHVLNKLGFINDSIVCCDIALNIDDMCEVAWQSKAYFYNLLKRYDASLSCCESSLLINTEDEFIINLKKSILEKIDG